MKESYAKDKICYNAKRYCKEDISLIDNYEAMMQDTSQRWVCHHRAEIDENKSMKQLTEEGRYYKVPAAELIFLTDSEHKKLHAVNMSEETKEKMKGNKNAVGNKSRRGKHHSEASKQKMSEAKKGRHWWNNEVEQVFAKECPGEGFTLGRLKRNKPDSYESGLPAAE